MRADLMVRTGDQAEERVSRQIAPWKRDSLAYVQWWKGWRGRGCSTYRLAADIWVPDLGIELHYRGAEGVIIWYPDVDIICTTFIGRAGRALEGTLEVCEVGRTDGAGFDIGEGVAVDIGYFFLDPASSAGRHAGEGRAELSVGMRDRCAKTVLI